MKIINETKWNTKDLQKIFALSLKADNKIEGKFNKNLIIIITYRKFRKWVIPYYERNNMILDNKYKYSGYAYFNTGEMKIRLPVKDIDSQYVAKIFIHELAHCRGYKHHQMGCWLSLDVSFLPDNIKIRKETNNDKGKFRKE